MEDNNLSQSQELRSRRNREPFMPENNEITMMEAVKSVFNNYANFRGRARRSEYWYWQLFNFIVNISIVMLSLPFTAGRNQEAGAVILLILFVLWFFISIIPTMAVIVRRLHDTGRSGWSYLISLIPFVGGIILLIWFIEDSKPGPNQWGGNPKGIGNDDFNSSNFN
ncbi:DUF805 domain-containing protein [Nonlabens sp.]|uniref:DUF805 domain-containing protein n=1 Tax=Nonlabens sp. TaxID=1888209 RepID=UPI003F69BC64